MGALVGSAVAKLADQAPSSRPLRVPRRATSQGDGGSPETRLLAAKQRQYSFNRSTRWK